MVSTIGWEVKIFRRGQRDSFARMMIVNGRAGSWPAVRRIRALVKSPLLVQPLSIYGRVLSIDSGLEGVTRVSPTYVRHARFVRHSYAVILALHSDFSWPEFTTVLASCHNRKKNERQRGKDKAL